MRYGLFFLFFILATTACFAQPYVDIISIKTIQSPDKSFVRRNKDNNSFQYFSAGLTLPVPFKKTGGALVLSPSFDNWQVALANNTQPLVSPERDHFFPSGIALPITLLTPVKHSNFLINTTLILRNHAEKINLPHSFQAGGLILVNYKISPTLTVKGGLYYNREAFGHFFMPLAGLEYKVDSTLQIWGTLPGSFFIEKKLKKRWYAGVTFKAVTSSYQLFENKYLQINDNQLSLFSDFYLTKSLVLNAEAGHSLFRRMRLGKTGFNRQYTYDTKTNDNYLFRLSAAYRIRL